MTINPWPDFGPEPFWTADSDDLIGQGDTVQQRIAYRIRAELVCCDIYDRDQGTDRAGSTHPICFWGEAAARIAESTR